MNEADFLANISGRLGRPVPLATAPERYVIGSPDFWKVYRLAPEDRIARFQTEFENTGGHVTICDSLEELQHGLAELLQTLTPSRIGTWGGDTLAKFEIEELLAAYDCVSWGEDSLNAFERAEVTVTACNYAIADTGTLVMKSDATRGRSVSILPPVHVALVRADQLYTRSGEVLEELAKEQNQMPASVQFISGPSSSSDIENDQTIGIHGPAAVYVFLLK